MRNLFSFDVFDTCLLRTHAFPTDVFVTLAAEFREKLEPICGDDYRVIFRNARVEAERRALSASGKEETTLDEIWSNLAAMHPGLDIEVGMAKELEVERNTFRVNPHLRDRVREVRARHGRVLFISDTYLPETFVIENLREHGFFVEGDGCYVSSAIGLTKRNGTLFRHVLATESVAPSNLVHLGDNPWGDVEVPRRLGVITEHYKATDLSPIERAMVIGAPSNDLEFASRLVSEMRRFRLPAVDGHEKAAREFVGAFLGPLLFVFATWVLGNAQRDGVRRLYFLSRDCYGLCKVASRLASRYGGIECRYLQVSRHSLCVPTIEEISPAGMPWMPNFPEQRSLGNLLSRVDLDLPSAGSAFACWAGASGAELRVRTKEDWDRFWELLSEEPLRSKLLDLAQARRITAVKYLESEGLFEEERVSVVDLGWLLTCQTALRKLLRSQNPRSDVRGYYLGISLNRRPLTESGAALAILYDEPGDRSSIGRPKAFTHISVLDAIFACAPHGSVRHYEHDQKRNAIRVRYNNKNDTQIFASEHLIAACVEFCNEMLRGSYVTPTNIGMFVRLLIDACITTPNDKWNYVIGGIRSSQDPNDVGAMALSEAYTWVEFLSTLLPYAIRKHLGINSKRRYWEEISYLSSGRNLKKAILLRKKLAEAFRRLRYRSA